MSVRQQKMGAYFLSARGFRSRTREAQGDRSSAAELLVTVDTLHGNAGKQKNEARSKIALLRMSSNDKISISTEVKTNEWQSRDCNSVP